MALQSKPSHLAIYLQVPCCWCAYLNLSAQCRSHFRFSQKNKTDCLCSNKLSTCINCPLASTCLSKFYVKKRGREKRKKKFFHRRNCSLITNRTPLSQELKRRAIYMTFPHNFALKYGVGRTNWCEQIY